MGSVADYLEVDGRYERAVEAGLGNLLQHVVVGSHEAAEAGLRFAEERNGGRVGFLVVNAAASGEVPAPREVYGATPMASVVRISGPAERAIAASIAHAWIAESRESARAAAVVDGAVVTLDGVVYRGARQVEGGARAEARRHPRNQAGNQGAARAARGRTGDGRTPARGDGQDLDGRVAGADSAIASVQSELHRQEKDIVGFDMGVRASADALDRITRKQDQESASSGAARKKSSVRRRPARRKRARRSPVSRKSSAAPTTG